MAILSISERDQLGISSCLGSSEGPADGALAGAGGALAYAVGALASAAVALESMLTFKSAFRSKFRVAGLVASLTMSFSFNAALHIQNTQTLLVCHSSPVVLPPPAVEFLSCLRAAPLLCCLSSGIL
ncbi:hypothetical protein LWI29_011126 [Acer saccharum]|uniref:Uncharacterized protein n=1 Tax=Acer saccharum TaxID=4024 RepID=A0AA39TAX6_ACESA|nr:hypothetical protein LWI29_011126 [Acer saccharum]